MCRRTAIALIFCLSVIRCLYDAPAALAVSNAVYKPQFLYVGTYPAKVLYKKSRPKSHWRKAFVNVNSDTVLCPEAKQALNTIGYWHGTILSDGTCIVSEPSDWTTGNWLNYIQTSR